jgi:AGCS family alanine or glycine:cation symporter
MEHFDELVRVAANWFALPLIVVLLSGSIFFTIRMRFVQVFRFRDAIRETIASRQSGASGPLSPLQAFMTSLAATIGVGNIAGVATAIVSGGPGAMFWIWCYGFLAMPMKFAEAALGMHYREASGDEVLAGPMYYLRDGLCCSPRRSRNRIRWPMPWVLNWRNRVRAWACGTSAIFISIATI